MKSKPTKSKTHKLCGLCNNVKPIESFYGANREYKTTHWCKSCWDRASFERRANRKKVFVRFLGGECYKCGLKHNEKNTVVFDFHHKDPKTKTAEWSQMRKWGIERIREEVLKCMLLCSNCHRIEHSIGHKKR